MVFSCTETPARPTSGDLAVAFFVAPERAVGTALRPPPQGGPLPCSSASGSQGPNSAAVRGP